jgi:hypothetical protein
VTFPGTFTSNGAVTPFLVILASGLCLGAVTMTASDPNPSTALAPSPEPFLGSTHSDHDGSGLGLGTERAAAGELDCVSSAPDCPLEKARASPVSPLGPIAAGSAAGPSVDVAFVIETTPYDGVYDPSAGDSGTDPCATTNGAAICEESNGVPFFVANAKLIAGAIQQANPKANVSFALVDYFATLDGHDDGDGAEYHVDIGSFINSNVTFGTEVTSTFQATALGGGYVYGDSDFSDNLLHSSVITALYGTITGVGLNWSASAHRTVVWMGSTAPRDPHYVEDYAVSASDSDSGVSSSCEPEYNFTGGSSSPACEGWVVSHNGIANDSIAGLALNSTGCTNSLGGICTIDMIDLNATPTDPASKGWPCPGGVNGSIGKIGGCPGGSAVVTNTEHVLDAGCDMAAATGGSWDGPSYFTCPNGAHGHLAGVFVTNSYTPTLTNPSLLGAFRNVTLGPIYPATFNESGLPAGAEWSVNVSGSTPVRSNGTGLSVTAPQGIDRYTVWSADRTYRAPGGSFTIAANASTAPVVSVDFSRVTFPVSFQEEGLPAGTGWSVGIAGSSVASTNSTLAFAEANGSYAFRVGEVPGWTVASFYGILTVTGGAVLETLHWIEVNYTVSFEENGLPNGTGWWINVSVVPGLYFEELGSFSQGGTLNLTEPNGTFAFNATDAATSYRSQGGSFQVDGLNATVTVLFTEVTYAVQVTAVGLPTGTNWSISVGGHAAYSTGANLTLQEPNGTYPYVVGDVPGWTAGNPSSWFSVNGAPVGVLISWTAVTYEVTFYEQGLPHGSSWSVTLRGSSRTGTGPLTFGLLPNGTYTYVVGPVPGEAMEPGSGSIEVNGSDAIQFITFTASPSPPPTLLGLPSSEGSTVLLGLALGLVVTGVAVAALVSRRRRTPPPATKRPR